jgi:hypothetical protein
MSELFLDSAYAIALSVANDEFHGRAMALRDQLKLQSTKLITTRAILLEIGNALAKPPYRPAAIRLLEAIESDPTIEIIPISHQLYARGFQLFIARRDKDWGLTDCVSFIVMQDLGVTSALTTDQHFQQAGFRALLREN